MAAGHFLLKHLHGVGGVYVTLWDKVGCLGYDVIYHRCLWYLRNLRHLLCSSLLFSLRSLFGSLLGLCLTAATLRSLFYWRLRNRLFSRLLHILLLGLGQGSVAEE